MKNKHIIILLVMISLILASCSTSLPEGQINGVLVAKGKPQRGFPLAIAPLSESDELITQGIYRANTDNEEGSFSFEGMSPGEYMLLLASPLTGYVYVLKGEAIYTFKLTEGSGVDLGTIDVSLTKPFP